MDDWILQVFWAGRGCDGHRKLELADRCGKRVLRGAPAVPSPSVTATGGGIHKRPSKRLSPNRVRICPNSAPKGVEEPASGLWRKPRSKTNSTTHLGLEIEAIVQGVADTKLIHARNGRRVVVAVDLRDGHEGMRSDRGLLVVN